MNAVDGGRASIGKAKPAPALTMFQESSTARF